MPSTRASSPFVRIVYRSALAAMPLGVAISLLGLRADSFGAAGVGLVMLVLGAVLWNDDTSPHHPARSQPQGAGGASRDDSD